MSFNFSLKDIDRNYFYLSISFLILTAGYLITEYIITSHQFGAPLDDVWIHIRFAENFARGHFYQYNIGEPTPGTTSPFWVIVLSLPFLISDSIVLPYALTVSSLFFLFTVFKVYKLSKRLGLNNNYSFLAAILTMLCGRLMWSSLSGMEITLFSLLSVIIVLNHLTEIETKKVCLTNGLLLGLAFNTRPETYLLAGIYYLTTLWLFRKDLNSNLLKIILSATICLVIVLPYPVFSYIHTGSFLPNTFKGQGGEFNYTPNFLYLYETGKLFAKDSVIILLLWITGTIFFIYSIFARKVDKKFLLINVWIFLLPAVSSFVASNWRHHGRYLVPLIPFINIIAINILLKFSNILRNRNFRLQNVIKNVYIALLILFSLNGCILFAWTLGWNVENINNQQVKIAKWLEANLSNEKGFALNDIGAITYFTKKPVVDMAGLVTPEVFKFQKMSYEEGSKNLFQLMKQYGVNYMIVYPDWYPYIMENYGKTFDIVYSAKLEKNTICGGPEMFVYKINWDKIDLK